MKQFLKKFIVCACAILLVTGCGSSDEKTTTTKKEEEKKSKGNCVAVECIKKIQSENTVEEINKIIGFEGKLTDEKYSKYYWELSEDEGVEVTYYSSDKGTIKITYNEDDIKNKKVDFSKYDEISSLLKSGTSLTYDEFVEKVGGVEGTLIEKGSITNKYTWIDSDGSYLNASFSTSSNKCTFVTGRIK